MENFSVCSKNLISEEKMRERIEKEQKNSYFDFLNSENKKIFRENLSREALAKGFPNYSSETFPSGDSEFCEPSEQKDFIFDSYFNEILLEKLELEKMRNDLLDESLENMQKLLSELQKTIGCVEINDRPHVFIKGESINASVSPEVAQSRKKLLMRTFGKRCEREKVEKRYFPEQEGEEEGEEWFDVPEEIENIELLLRERDLEER